jgi:heme-degrading monooxygenase HmoA
VAVSRRPWQDQRVTVYTMGIWTVKPDREDEFVAAWDALEQWTLERGFDTHGTLVRDRSAPHRFISFGPWRSAEEADRWKANPGFQERFARISDMIERFDEGIYDVVMRVS